MCHPSFGVSAFWRAGLVLMGTVVVFIGPAVAQESAAGVSSENFESPWKRQDKKPDGTKIIGGKPVTELKYWPGMATLRYRDSANNVAYFCGGVMISEQWMVTAAHCLDQWQCANGECAPRSKYDLKAIDVFAEHGMSGTGRVEVVTGATDLTKSDHQAFSVTKGIVYPAYVTGIEKQLAGTCKVRSCPGIVGDDIALVQIEGTYKGSLARLATAADDPPDRDRIRTPVGVAGFGRTVADAKLKGQRSGPITVVAASMKLMETMVPTVPHTVCEKQYSVEDYKILKSQICASDEKTQDRDTCQGDSGGPLVAYDRKNKPYVVGLTSWGAECAKSGFSGVYTRVSTKEYRDWMRKYGVVPLTLRGDERVRFEDGDRARKAAAAATNAGDLMLSICDTGKNLKCKSASSSLPASDNLLAVKIKAPEDTGGNLVIFTVTPAGQVEQLFPRGNADGLEDHRILAKKEWVVPRGNAAAGFRFDWDLEDGTIAAVLLPAVGGASLKKAQEEIRNAGIAAEPGQGRPADGERYIATILKAARDARQEAAVSVIKPLAR